MLSKIKKTFLTKSFLTFCIIGGLAYLLHQGIYLLYTKTFGFYDDKNHLISTAIAFTVASIFTYLQMLNLLMILKQKVILQLSRL